MAAIPHYTGALLLCALAAAPSVAQLPEKSGEAPGAVVLTLPELETLPLEIQRQVRLMVREL